MCGIAGFVHAEADARHADIKLQLDCLTHRGPDSSGYHRGEGAVIGQTRLAVIDLVTGDPPIANEDGSIGAALNGEIYNYQDLRQSLLDRGHTFSSAGDTEVIAHLAEELEPPELASALDGMFGFAVWDDRRKRLIIARDRFGKKPLYYWTDGRALVFASEIKALVAHPLVPQEFAPDAIPAYLRFGYVPTPDTFFRGIKSLPPGHVLVLERGGIPQIERYWSLDPAGSYLELPTSGMAERVRACLTEAVSKRLIADVPLGAFLSGGIDSSAIVGIMSELVSEPVRTFTIGFEDDDGFDERTFARSAARRFGTDHTEFVVQPEAIDLIDRLVWHYDQPFGDSSAIPTFLLSELTRKEVTVALSGDGGDELFAGYQRIAAAYHLAAYRRLPAGIRNNVERIVTHIPLPAKLRRFAERAQLGPFEAFSEWIATVPVEHRRRMLGHARDPGLESYRVAWDRTDGAHMLDRLQLLTIDTYLVDDLLPKADRMSMAHGLEVRSPFLDHELAALAFSIPPNARLRGLSSKRILKEAVKDLLPEDILRRGKRGFGVPLDRWFRTDLVPYMSELLSPSARCKRYLDGSAVDALVQEHQAGTRGHGHALWTLLTLELFLRKQGW